MKPGRHILRITAQLSAKVSKHGRASLSEPERNLLLVWLYRVAIDARGHASFLRSAHGAFAHETVHALIDTGSPDFAAVLQHAIDLCPSGGSSPHLDERESMRDSMPQTTLEAMTQCDTRFRDLGGEWLMDRLLEYWQRRAA